MTDVRVMNMAQQQRDSHRKAFEDGIWVGAFVIIAFEVIIMFAFLI